MQREERRCALAFYLLITCPGCPGVVDADCSQGTYMEDSPSAATNARSAVFTTAFARLGAELALTRSPHSAPRSPSPLLLVHPLRCRTSCPSGSIPNRGAADTHSVVGDAKYIAHLAHTLPRAACPFLPALGSPPPSPLSPRLCANKGPGSPRLHPVSTFALSGSPAESACPSSRARLAHGAGLWYYTPLQSPITLPAIQYSAQ